MNLTRLVPDTPLARSQTGVVRALESIYDQADWSWQKGFAGWLAPGILFDTGSFTTTPYSNVVTGDAVASAAFAAYTGRPLLTELQYRNPAYAIYDITSITFGTTIVACNLVTGGSGQTDGTFTVPVLDNGPGSGATVSVTVTGGMVINPPTVLAAGSNYVAPYITFSEGGTPATFQPVQNYNLVLDRPWMEPTTGPGQPFVIYQVYFVAPAKDFRKFISIQDFTNDQPIDFWSKTQADLAFDDPQRQDFSIPLYAVPAGFDHRQGSATYGWPRYELWPHQANYCPYALNYRRRGKLPESQPDWQAMFPEHPITENMLEFKAKEILLLDKAAEMEAKVPGSGRGMTLLAGLAQKTYYELFGQVLAIDLNLDGENLTHVHQPGVWQAGEPYANMYRGLNLGGYPTGGGV